MPWPGACAALASTRRQFIVTCAKIENDKSDKLEFVGDFEVHHNPGARNEQQSAATYYRIRKHTQSCGSDCHARPSRRRAAGGSGNDCWYDISCRRSFDWLA